MKNATDADEEDDGHPGVDAEPGEVVRRVDPEQLLEEAPEAVVGDVEREERGRPEGVAPVEPEEEQRLPRDPR